MVIPIHKIYFSTKLINSTVKISADDTKFYNKETNSDILQQDLDALFVWS